MADCRPRIVAALLVLVASVAAVACVCACGSSTSSGPGSGADAAQEENDAARAADGAIEAPDSGSDGAPATGTDAAAPDAASLLDASPDASSSTVDSAAPPCAPMNATGVGGVLDVTTFDASADGGDWYPAIQAAIDQACDAGANFYGRPPPVFLPPGRFATSQPLLLNCNDLELEGACRSGTTIAPQFAGPAVLINPGNAITLTTGPALVGSGSSFQTEVPQHLVYINLRDMPEVELGGLPAFTAEAFIDLTSAYAPGYASIVDSAGCNAQDVGALPCASAFRLAVTTQTLYGALTAGGTTYTLNGPTITLGVVHHTALTYDGTTLRLFLDGALVASTPATGAVTMLPHENVTVGVSMYGLEASSINGGMPGSIDSVRLSSVARYVSAFTPPTAELAADGSTLALANFDTNLPGLTLGASKDGPFWLPVRRATDSAGNGINFVGGVSINHLAVEGGMGIFGWLAATTSIYQADCIGCDYGFALLGNNYLGRLDDVSATAGGGRGRFGVFTTSGNGNGFNNVSVSGQTFPFVSVSAAEQIVTNLSVTAGPSTMYGVTLLNGDDALDGVHIDATGAGAAWRGAIAGVVPWAKLHVQRGTIGTANGAPAIVIDEGVGVLVEGTSFTGTAGSPEVVHLAGATTSPNIVLAATKDSTVAWSDDPSLVVPAGPDPAAVPDPSTLPASAFGPSVVRGEVPASSVFDVAAYGAVPGGTDAAPGIQAAVNAACAHGGGTVFLHTGDYWVSTPVVVDCGITIEGASRILTGIVARETGPALVLNPASMTGIDLAPALVGTGSAMTTDGASYWLELRDDPLVELNGLAAFTAEAFVKMSAAPAAYGGIVQSHGCLGTGATLPGCTSAFSLAASGDTLVAALAVGAATYSLQGPTLTTGVVHHVALTYDGAAVRLFLDGALVASDAATGTVTQGIHEDVTAGPSTTGFDGAAVEPAMPGVIDSIRLSSSARYTAAFTPPTAKLGSDATSLIVVNFETNTAGSTLVSDQNGSGRWLAVRRTAEPGGAAEATVAGVTLKNFTSGELFGMNAVGGRYLEMVFGGDAPIELEGTSAGSYFESLDVGAAGPRGRYGMLVAGGGGNVYRDLNVSYAEIPLVVYGGANQLFYNAVLSPAPTTGVYGALLLGAGATFEGLYFDNESTMPAFVGDVVVTGSLSPFTLLKGEIDLGSQGIPITIDRGDGVIIEGASFGNSNLSPEVVHVSAPTTGTAEAIGVTFTSAELSDDTGFVSVGN